MVQAMGDISGEPLALVVPCLCRDSSSLRSYRAMWTTSAAVEAVKSPLIVLLSHCLEVLLLLL